MEEQRYITDDLSDIETSKLMNSLPNYFDFSGDMQRTAYLNWRFEFNRDLENQFYDMAKGYFETSLSLIENCLSDNLGHKADIWIFPIMFNVVHGIEVYLKGFNSQYRILAKLQRDEYQATKIEGKHDIRQLCQVAISLVKDNNDKDLLVELTFIKRFIDILYANTDDMTFARYPVTSKGEQHFYVKEKDNVTIDLDVFRQWVIRVFHILDSCTGFIDFQVDQILEWKYEMQQEYGDY
ncbi:hypothetical protein [Lachnoclostridium phytofermentans]|uniref:hypothetical protein n=1 Tax=Lachnoclostridium phytofermentans TaxID=66219 RepID=UPI0004979258|nr:hypothetical protein [Lachnoclostridium phytofermentans]